jgi:hypothetical protein
LDVAETVKVRLNVEGVVISVVMAAVLVVATVTAPTQDHKALICTTHAIQDHYLQHL